MEAAISNFFTAAGNLYQAAGNIHDQDVSSDVLVSDVVDVAHVPQSLRHIVDCLQGTVDEEVIGVQGIRRIRSLGGMAAACQKVARDLLIRLDRIGNSESTKDSVDLTVGDARAAWPKEDVDALGERLRGMLREWTEVNPQSQSDNLEAITEDLSGLNIASTPKSQHGGDLVGEESAKQAESEYSRGRGAMQSMMKGLKDQGSHSNGKPQYAPIATLQDFILDSLSYKSMRDREEEVADAHGSSFDWIFQEDATDDTNAALSGHFIKWLRTDELGSIYWVNGKPGSGKSTLMRYLSEHISTLAHLESWAGDYPVVKAGFFFWTSGSEVQRSQTGLLRYLLHQLLSYDRDLIPTTFPEIWEKISGMSTKERIKYTITWSVSELMDSFRRFLDAAVIRTKICLFVDGLDEFDGDHAMIINFFRSLVEGPQGHQIKACLSSRPWNIFEEAFQYSVPSLRLQDLNFQDMYDYASDNLYQDAIMGRLLTDDPEGGGALLADIARKADGVFLWVRLVVSELLSKAKEGDRLTDVRGRLEQLPADLEALFDLLLFHRQSDVEVTEAAEIFQLIRAREIVVEILKDEAASALTIWDVAFALDADDNHDVVGAPVREPTDAEVFGRCQTTSNRILSRSAGLLEIYEKTSRGNRRDYFTKNRSIGVIARRLAGNKVTYLHRTIRDYLMYSAGVWERLVEPPQSRPFDPHLRLLRSHVMHLKRPLEPPEQHRRLDEWWPDIALSLTHARHIDPAADPTHLQTEFINELNFTIQWYWLPRDRSDPSDHWARAAFGSYETRGRIHFHNPFLSLATKFGLTTYVSDEISAGALDNIPVDYTGTPLLSYATEFLCSTNHAIFPLSSPTLVSLLLTHPTQNPNASYKDFNTHCPTTPWLAVLRRIRDAVRRHWIDFYDIDPDGTKRWSEIVRLFLVDGGADAAAVVAQDRWDPEITAAGVLELVRKERGDWEVEKTRVLLEEIKERQKGGMVAKQEEKKKKGKGKEGEEESSSDDGNSD